MRLLLGPELFTKLWDLGEPSTRLCDRFMPREVNVALNKLSDDS